MLREMRRKNRQMTEEDTIEVLKEAEYGVLSTICKGNIPYGIPMSFAYEDECIYLHCALDGQKLDNIENNNQVSFTVITSTELMPQAFSTKYTSAIAIGEISIVNDIEEKRKGLILMIKKYSPDFYESGLKYINNAFNNVNVLKIKINKITGKARL